LKRLIEKNAFAKVENAYNFAAFKRYVGAYGEFRGDENKEAVFNVLMRKCPHIGNIFIVVLFF
jgi:hypothetical protein